MRPLAARFADMDIHLRIVSSIVVLLALICLAMLLRRVGLLEERHGPLFSKLITKVTLPALIFVSLARTELHWSEGLVALIMVCVTLVCLAVGWVIATLMRLDGFRKAPVILATGFGSSSLLGFALIGEVFPSSARDLAEAAIVSGLGVQPTLFTLGTVIAIYYGSGEADPGARLAAALRFFYSPIFISLVAGIGVSLLLEGWSDPVITSLLDGIHVVGAANTFLVALAVGLLLRFSALRQVAAMAIPVGAIKLLAMPLLLWLPTLAISLPDWQIQVLILQGAMPSAMLPVVLCSTYGCDAKLASGLVFATTVASVVTLPFMFSLLV